MIKTAVPVRLETAEIGRHYHERPYATLVIEGGYVEAGDQGRYDVAPGEVLLHSAFSAHGDRVRSPRTFVLDLPLPTDGRSWPAHAQISDPDHIIRTARRDSREARDLLIEGLRSFARTLADPADFLAEAVSVNPSMPIGAWTARHGYSREWLSRRFKRLYGIDTAVFRLEARTRSAWRRIVSSAEPLAHIAADCGFADQAHMTRAVGRLTGRSPRAWRWDPAVTFVQESR